MSKRESALNFLEALRNTGDNQYMASDDDDSDFLDDDNFLDEFDRVDADVDEDYNEREILEEEEVNDTNQIIYSIESTINGVNENQNRDMTSKIGVVWTIVENIYWLSEFFIFWIDIESSKLEEFTTVFRLLSKLEKQDLINNKSDDLIKARHFESKNKFLGSDNLIRLVFKCQTKLEIYFWIFSVPSGNYVDQASAGLFFKVENFNFNIFTTSVINCTQITTLY
ncbi:hypothetical protein BpHYR1_000479, partial [Brachionus plicatilis]